MNTAAIRPTAVVHWANERERLNYTPLLLDGTDQADSCL
jgi:hypothetical protein